MHVDPKSNDRCPWKKRGGDLRHRATQGRRFVQMDAQVGVMWPEAQGGLASPKDWTRPEGPSAGASGGSSALPTPWSQVSDSRTGGGGDEFVLKLSSLWPVAAATPGHWEWTCWLQGENSGRTHPLPPNPNTQSCHEVKWVHTHRWLNQGLTFGSQPASLPPPRHHHRHCEGPSSTHSVDIQGPDAGSEASELGGSTQGSPCLLGPHGEGLCSDTETPGEAGSSGRGRHGRLSIRGGGLIRVHPGGVQPFTQSGGRTPCGTQCPVASPCHGRLWAEPWMTRSLHLTRGRGWRWGNPQWGFFF